MKKTLKISELCQGLAVVSEKEDREITGIGSDSREIQPGGCFVALPGLNQDGSHFIMDAIQRGAAAVLIDDGIPALQGISVPLIRISRLTEKVGEIASRYYDHPSEKISLIGVTGTNGKTSTTQFIAQAMMQHAMPCAVMGTLGYGFPNQLTPSSHTTSTSFALYRQLAELAQQGAKTIAMEVSSHAIDQKRIAGLTFDSAIFTNLSQDHLDYHLTMENYGAVKRQLFYTRGLKQAIINLDDNFGFYLAKELQDILPVYGYGLKHHEINIPSVLVKRAYFNGKGMAAQISSPWGEGQLRSRLLGRFNLSNLLAVITALQLQGVDFHQALKYVDQLQTVPGRMQVLGGGKLPLVVVDYAHTPDALLQVLLALREHAHGALWCIFGCGGDRDKGKRPIMGQIAERYSDHLIITDDNPRTEHAGEIVNDIMNGLLCPWAVEIEHDRGAAIAHAINCASPGDVVLVAGKGHEEYQIIGQEKIPFSDVSHIQSQLRLKQKM